MRESKKSEGGAFKAPPPPPPDRIGLNGLNLAQNLQVSCGSGNHILNGNSPRIPNLSPKK